MTTKEFLIFAAVTVSFFMFKASLKEHILLFQTQADVNVTALLDSTLCHTASVRVGHFI